MYFGSLSLSKREFSFPSTSPFSVEDRKEGAGHGERTTTHPGKWKSILRVIATMQKHDCVVAQHSSSGKSTSRWWTIQRKLGLFGMLEITVFRIYEESARSRSLIYWFLALVNFCLRKKKKKKLIIYVRYLILFFRLITFIINLVASYFLGIFWRSKKNVDYKIKKFIFPISILLAMIRNRFIEIVYRWRVSIK